MDVNVDPSFIRDWAAGAECRELMTDIALDVESEFREIVPRRTGNLAASAVAIPQMNGGQWEAIVDARIYYAAFVEFETRYTDAQYNMRTALENVTGQS